MTLVPDQRWPLGAANTVRTILFWVLMIALAVVLWQMSSKNSRVPAAAQMSYSDFMSQVEKINVSAVHLYESPSTAEIQGQLREPPREFRVTIPKETIPELTDELRKQGASVQVSEMRNSGLTNTLINVAPFALILAIWVFIINRRNRTPRATPPFNAPNRPIG